MLSGGPVGGPAILDQFLRVPLLYTWLEGKLRDGPPSAQQQEPYPILLEESRKVCRLFEIVASERGGNGTLTSQLHASLEEEQKEGLLLDEEMEEEIEYGLFAPANAK